MVIRHTDNDYGIVHKHYRRPPGPHDAAAVACADVIRAARPEAL